MNSTERDMAQTQLETLMTTRLLDLLTQAQERGVPPDTLVRCLLGAALALALRHDTGSSIATQLQPVINALRDVGDATSH